MCEIPSGPGLHSEAHGGMFMAESQRVLGTWLNVLSPGKETDNLQRFPAPVPPSAPRTLAVCLRLSTQKAEDDTTTRKKILETNTRVS